MTDLLDMVHLSSPTGGVFWGSVCQPIVKYGDLSGVNHTKTFELIEMHADSSRPLESLIGCGSKSRKGRCFAY